MKALIKPFEASQKNVKIKIKVNLILILMQLSEMYGAGRVNMRNPWPYTCTVSSCLRYPPDPAKRFSQPTR